MQKIIGIFAILAFVVLNGFYVYLALISSSSKITKNSEAIKQIEKNSTKDENFEKFVFRFGGFWIL